MVCSQRPPRNGPGVCVGRTPPIAPGHACAAKPGVGVRRGLLDHLPSQGAAGLRAGCSVEAGAASNGLGAPPSPTNHRAGVELPLREDPELPRDAEVGKKARSRRVHLWSSRLGETTLWAGVGVPGVGCAPGGCWVLEGGGERTNPAKSDEFPNR